MENQSVVLFEIPPQWEKPSNKIERPVAKATYVKAQNLWEIYWQRADLKWHSDAPTPTVKTFEGFLQVVGEDQHACFFG